MPAQILNTVGLFCGIAGAIEVWRWGLSFEPESFGYRQPDEKVVDTRWGRMTVIEAIRRDEQERTKHRRRGRIGMALIGLGSALQAVAVWIPGS